MATNKRQSTHLYQHELNIAILAAQRAAVFTDKVNRELSMIATGNTVIKSDQSPVTIGDFGSEALIIRALRYAFPNDGIIAEEDSCTLSKDSRLKETLWSMVHDIVHPNPSSEAELGGHFRNIDDMTACINSFNTSNPDNAIQRYWTIDPIDGTKGFLRGGQYAICVSLLVNGHPVLGVIACPNFPHDAKLSSLQATVNSTSSYPLPKGLLFWGILNHGSYYTLLDCQYTQSQNVKKLCVNLDTTLDSIIIAQSWEKSHSSQHVSSLLLAKLSHTDTLSINHSDFSSNIARFDSQAKYAALAMGLVDLYLRVPVSKTSNYIEKIWDHAAGYILVCEAGGIVSDINGKPLDFSRGRELTENRGILAAPKHLHAQILTALTQLLPNL